MDVKMTESEREKNALTIKSAAKVVEQFLGEFNGKGDMDQIGFLLCTIADVIKHSCLSMQKAFEDGLQASVIPALVSQSLVIVALNIKAQYDTENRTCVNCGCTARQASRASPPEELCPLNPGCEYE